MRGTVWIDGAGGSLDGQREPGEVLVPGSAGGFWGLWLSSEDGSQVIRAVVDAEGHYSVTVKLNRYFVEVDVYAIQWGYTTPNVGDEATDSDVTPTFSDDVDALARSEVFEVTGGGETAVDVGLTELAAT